MSDVDSVSNVKVSSAGHVTTVMLDNPPVNALTRAMMRELTDVFSSAGDGWDCRSVLLSAAPGRAFCGGVDLNDPEGAHGGGQTAQAPADFLDIGRSARRLFQSVLDCPVPVVAAVGGASVGAGVALLACADIIIASDQARFALPEINAGVLGGGRHLQRLVGPFKARSMLFTGDFASAADFYRLGAIEEVLAPDELDGRAKEWANRLAAKSPIGLRLAKESLARAEHLPLMEGYRIEQDYTAKMVGYEDSTEARDAFLRRRDPQWKLR